MHPESLAVIGLGAIGGSVAWQAARAGVARVLGCASTPTDGTAALRVGAVTELVTAPERAVERADLVVLAAPPRPTLDLLTALGPALAARRCLCTDVTSVKVPVVRRARELGLGALFAGSHPFAGTHERGFAAARPDLFTGCVVYVTPLEEGERAAAEVGDFWHRVLGAHTVPLPAETHDALLAWTSHLPQAIASALAVALGEHTPRGASVGSGAKSTTRLAASSVAMWTDILLLNRASVLEALGAFGATTDALRRALETEDAAELTRWLEAGRAWRAQFDD